MMLGRLNHGFGQRLPLPMKLHSSSKMMRVCRQPAPPSIILVSSNPVPLVSGLTLSSTCSLLLHHLPSYSSTTRRKLACRMSNSELISHLELDKPDGKRVKRLNGIFWIILLNLGIFVADHLFQVRGIQSLYLYHNWPAWYQFVTATFCHADWNHLSSNLFFLYIFGKLVEEEEGNFALWFSYILTGAGANLVSWLLLPRNSISVGASGAVFGLFTISVLVKLCQSDPYLHVMEAAQASAGLSPSFRGSYSLQSINHLAHLSGALVGVLLVWLLSRFPAEPSQRS